MLAASCIDPFEPQIEGEEQEVLVINGFISDGAPRQQVQVSHSAPYGDPAYRPVSGCVVHVSDEGGDLLVYDETSPGLYIAEAARGFLAPGKSYALHVQTPDGETYQSDHDRMLHSPPMDSLYYEVAVEESSDPDFTRHGLQFYVDVSGPEHAAGSYRWLIQESWEYTAPRIPEWVEVSRGQVQPFGSDSLYRCYRETRVEALFSASSSLLSQKALLRSPLHYVSNETPRLKHTYGIEVEQQALTEQAYAYWERMKEQRSSGGNLYEQQPASVVGNLSNVNDPGEKVLGIFYATSVQQSSLVVRNHFDFPVDGFRCTPDTVRNQGQLDALLDTYPRYLVSISESGIGFPYLAGNACFDCRKLGGSTQKPAVW